MSDMPFMNRRQAAGAALLGALAAAVPALAEAKPAQSAMEPIAALLHAHNKAFTAQDLRGVLATMTSNAVLMGTSPGELWAGQGEISDAYRHFFLDFDSGRQRFENLWWDGGVTGNTAWLMAVSKVTMLKGASKREFGLNVSLTCAREGGRWLIRSLHFSNLVKA